MLRLCIYEYEYEYEYEWSLKINLGAWSSVNLLTRILLLGFRPATSLQFPYETPPARHRNAHSRILPVGPDYSLDHGLPTILYPISPCKPS